MPQSPELLHYAFRPAIIALFALNILIILVILRNHLSRKYSLGYKIQQMQEKVNVVNEEASRQESIRGAREAKKNRYNNLKKLTEEINKEFDQDAAAEKLISAVFSLIARNTGTCLLYLSDRESRKLSLYKAKKEDRGLVIKAKEGDVFDSWVLRHCVPLLVEDVSRDFRFEGVKPLDFKERKVGSLISAPLVTDQGMLGIIRLEGPEPDFFSQDDLRLLSTICDLGAVAFENTQLYKRIEDMALHDSLTSFTTRAYFIQSLKDEIKRSLRNNGIFSFLIADVDFFKKYNDKFGHIAGDEVLKILSRIFKEHLKEYNSIIGRYGGEEFAVILPQLSEQEGKKVAEGLRIRVEKEKILLRRQVTGITISIGVASFPQDSDDAEGLIKKADAAMYEAKAKGRNRVCLA